MRLRDRIIEIIEDQSLAILATSMDNIPHTTLVAFRADLASNSVFFVTPISSRSFQLFLPIFKASSASSFSVSGKLFKYFFKNFSIFFSFLSLFSSIFVSKLIIAPKSEEYFPNSCLISLRRSFTKVLSVHSPVNE
jgi:hypothetical protein